MLLLSLDGGGLVEVLLDVLEGDEGDHLGLCQHFVVLAPFFEVEEILLGDIVLVFSGHIVDCSVENEIALALPLVPVIHFQHFPLPLLSIEGIKRQCLQEMGEVVGFVVGAVSHAEAHELHHILEVGNGWVDFPESSYDIFDTSHHSAVLPKMQHPMLVPLLQLDLQVAAFDLFKHPPASLRLAQNGSIALLEHHLILLEHLQREVR